MRLGLLLGLLALVTVLGAAHAEVVDSDGDVGLCSSMDLDANGYPHISYYDASNRELKYVYYDGLTWHVKTVATNLSSYCYDSIAVDQEGNPHISYYSSRGFLMYYHKSTYQIGYSLVDNSGNVGKYNSIAIDSNGNLHISYYDETNGDLKYAYKDASSSWAWVTETVDSDGNVGQYTSIALDANGYPHISYYDITNGTLKYAYKDASGWHIETVDSQGVVGTYTSIAIDQNGYPHISYRDETNDDLKYAYKDASGSWVTETVDSDGNVGYSTSIAIDPNGNPHISYYDASNGDLKYASDRGFNPISMRWEWRITTVDSSGIVGHDTSIAIDPNGNPHISYYDASNGDLKYTTKQPTIVNLQGGITDLNGNPVATASMRVTIKNQDGRTVYTETLNDVLSGGKFNVLLGAIQELELWSDAKYNLVIDVDVDSTAFAAADVTFGDNNPSGDVIVFYP